MRNPERIPEFLARLEKVWRKVPDWRFMQLICNMPWDRDPFYFEDDEAIKLIEDYFKEDESNADN